jgi:hypothetical protein
MHAGPSGARACGRPRHPPRGGRRVPVTRGDRARRATITRAPPRRRDVARVALAASPACLAGLVLVGWYRSWPRTLVAGVFGRCQRRGVHAACARDRVLHCCSIALRAWFVAALATWRIERPNKIWRTSCNHHGIGRDQGAMLKLLATVSSPPHSRFDPSPNGPHVLSLFLFRIQLPNLHSFSFSFTAHSTGGATEGACSLVSGWAGNSGVAVPVWGTPASGGLGNIPAWASSRRDVCLRDVGATAGGAPRETIDHGSADPGELPCEQTLAGAPVR